MKIHIIRHGEAVSDSVDPTGPLSERGKKDVQKISQFIKNSNINVRKIYHSPKRRAQETAQILKETINPAWALITQEYLSPNHSVNDMVKEIFQAKEDIMIVGHLPFLSKLVSKLVTEKDEGELIKLNTAGYVVLDEIFKLRFCVLMLIDPQFL